MDLQLGWTNFYLFYNYWSESLKKALPFARKKKKKKLSPSFINLEKKPQKLKTDIFWKRSMPRQDYNQQKAENQEPSLRNVPSWQSLSLTATTFVRIGIDGVFFPANEIFFFPCKWTYFNPLHAFVPCHLQGQNLIHKSAFVLFHGPSIHVQRLTLYGSSPQETRGVGEAVS